MQHATRGHCYLARTAITCGNSSTGPSNHGWRAGGGAPVPRSVCGGNIAAPDKNPAADKPSALVMGTGRQQKEIEAVLRMMRASPEGCVHSGLDPWVGRWADRDVNSEGTF